MLRREEGGRCPTIKSQCGIANAHVVRLAPVNIIKSNISHAVVQITRSGKDAISRETARKLEQIINSEEIKGLPEEDRFDVLDQADDVIKELSAPVTDKGKVYRGLKRLGRFISSVASKPLAHFVAQLAVAYAKAHGV